jgi:hypothetical protein
VQCVARGGQVSKERAIDVNAPQRCERYVLEVHSYSRNIGW